MACFHHPADGWGLRVEAVAEDVVLPFPVPAGEFHAGQKGRVLRTPEPEDLLTALQGVVIRQGKEPQTGLPGKGQEGLGRIGPVGDRAVQMEVELHNGSPF